MPDLTVERIVPFPLRQMMGIVIPFICFELNESINKFIAQLRAQNFTAI